MIDRATKLRLRRQARMQKRKLVAASADAEQGFEKMFVRRLERLGNVKRFVAAWLLLIVLVISGLLYQTQSLTSYYLEEQSVPGGVINEGILGVFTNANPIYATGAVDNAVSRLVFSGLMRHNQSNVLVTDLAESITSDDRADKFTVVLRQDLRWHDGQAVTSEDVVFTYKLIKNPDVRSPLFNSWRSVTVTAVDDRTIIFELPNALASFPYSLTNGILPKHILGSVDVSQLRSHAFNNINPIGTGPFKWDKIAVNGTTPEDRQEIITLQENNNYHHGPPKLERFIVTTYRDEESLTHALGSRHIDAAAGFDQLSDELTSDNIQTFNMPLTGQVNAFLKTTVKGLDDPAVRRALVQATNRFEILKGFATPVLAAKGPFLESHFTYDSKLVQKDYNVEAAVKQLDKAGWKLQDNGIRTKGKDSLSFRLSAEATSEYRDVSRALQNQWREVGIDVQVDLFEASDLQTKASNHEYDILLYGVSLGNDPDVFPYWHSSQASPNSGSWLNFSEYASDTADESLEAGRTRTDPELRIAKYQPFLKAWLNDAPAIALYQPHFLYIANRPIANFEPKQINSAADRYNNVHNWMIHRDNVIKPLTKD